MCDYIDTPSNTAKAGKAIKYLTTIRSRPIMEWDESAWVVDKPRPSYLSVAEGGGGFHVIHPTWTVLNS